MTDPMYQGEYNGSRKHDPDLEDVLDRARTHGLQKLIVTAGTLEDSKKALDLARQKGLFLNIIFVSLKGIVESMENMEKFGATRMDLSNLTKIEMLLNTFLICH